MSVPEQSAYQRYKDVRFFGSLNGLRFLCIIAVMWHHSPAYGALDPDMMLLKRGFLGVDFFFVLSGYLITTLLLREEERHGSFSIRGFYWRRILRIVPVYFLVVSAVSFYFIVVKGQGEFAPLVPYYYLFLSNMLVEDIPLLTITWSLAVEEQYYMLWPALLLLLPMAGRIRFWVLVALIAICVVTALGIGPLTGSIATTYAIFKLPVSSYAAILIGSLAAILLHRQRSFDLLYAALGARVTPVICFALLVVVLSVTPLILTGWPNLAVHGVMAICLISIVIREDHVAAGLFAWRPIARIGEISYGLYLYHLIGRHVGVELGSRMGLAPTVEPWVITAIFVIVAIAIAELSFRTFEAYFLAQKDRFKPVREAG